MKDWQQRVVDEKAELDEKLGKLDSYVEKGCPGASEAEAGLLAQQRSDMKAYSSTLEARIAGW